MNAVAAFKNIVKKILGRPVEEDWRDVIPWALQKRLPEGRPLTVIDVGAHDGDFTRALSRKFEIAHAVLVEALPHKAEKLRAEFAGPRFMVVECAATDHSGSVEFEMNNLEETSSLLKIHRDLPELASLKLVTAKMLQVQARTLDEIAASVGEIDVLKVDVQGAELLVLTGGQAALARTRFIWIEVSFKELYENSPTFFDVYAACERAGFGLADMQAAYRGPSGEMLQADVLFLRK